MLGDCLGDVRDRQLVSASEQRADRDFGVEVPADGNSAEEVDVEGFSLMKPAQDRSRVRQGQSRGEPLEGRQSMAMQITGLEGQDVCVSDQQSGRSNQRRLSPTPRHALSLQYLGSLWCCTRAHYLSGMAASKKLVPASRPGPFPVTSPLCLFRLGIPHPAPVV
jgi:hypothetical protein